MRRSLTALLVVGLISISTREAAAQPSASDVAAYAALLSTPVGGLTPIMVAPGTKGEKAFNSLAGRYSHFSCDGCTGSNTFGGTYYRQAGMNAAVAATAAYGTCDGCDGTLMLGADVQSTLWDNAAAKSTTRMSVNLQGNLGWGHAGGTTDANALSVAIGAPLAIAMQQSNKSSFSLFVTPGFGWGRLSSGGASESGTRPIVGAGAAWQAAGGWGIHAGFNKVFIENGGQSIGAGFSYRLP
jgi:hypothetical protein